METSYPGSGSVNDSREGGPEELEEVETGQVKDVGIQVLVGHPSPNF